MSRVMCGSVTCQQPATLRMFWPGRPPQPTCAACLQRARGVAEVMGFYLHAEFYGFSDREVP